MFILWVLLAAGCGLVASAKGRSGFGWFALGLIMPLIVLIIVACLPAVTSETKK